MCCAVSHGLSVPVVCCRTGGCRWWPRLGRAGCRWYTGRRPLAAVLSDPRWVGDSSLLQTRWRCFEVKPSTPHHPLLRALCSAAAPCFILRYPALTRPICRPPIVAPAVQRSRGHPRSIKSQFSFRMPIITISIYISPSCLVDTADSLSYKLLYRRASSKSLYGSI